MQRVLPENTGTRTDTEGCFILSKFTLLRGVIEVLVVGPAGWHHRNVPAMVPWWKKTILVHEGGRWWKSLTSMCPWLGPLSHIDTHDPSDVPIEGSCDTLTTPLWRPAILASNSEFRRRHVSEERSNKRRPQQRSQRQSINQSIDQSVDCVIKIC